MTKQIVFGSRVEVNLITKCICGGPIQRLHFFLWRYLLSTSRVQLVQDCPYTASDPVSAEAACRASASFSFSFRRLLASFISRFLTASPFPTPRPATTPTDLRSTGARFSARRFILDGFGSARIHGGTGHPDWCTTFAILYSHRQFRYSERGIFIRTISDTGHLRR